MPWTPPLNWNGWARFSASYSEAVNKALEFQKNKKTKIKRRIRKRKTRLTRTTTP